jgi:tRNA(adenine34) deaminase
MAVALQEARVAFDEDEVPVGAVLVRNGEILARDHNRCRSHCDPTAHAEILVVRESTRALGLLRLEGTTLYSTVEPCFLCAGALVHARVARAVWAIRDEKFGGCVSLGNALDHPRANHKVEMHEGVSREEALALMQRFFRARR